MIHDTSHNWKYSTDILQVGGRLVKEVYVGSKKVYPMGVNLMGLREIIEDDAAFYGDAGGQKYNWYVQFEPDYIFNTFGTGDRNGELRANIFCDYHAPNNGHYYGNDLDKPIGFANWGDTRNVTIDNVTYKDLPVMRWMYYCASTAEKAEIFHESLWYAYMTLVNPNWTQGHGSGAEYYHPGDDLIWTGWHWWLTPMDRYIFKYDFIKRDFGPELRGSDLWVPVDEYDPYS